MGDHGDLGRDEVREVLAVEHLGLEDGPEGLDLAIGPGRVDLGADVTDRQLGEGALDRLTIQRVIATKGVPFSVMSASGMPHGSIKQ